MSARPIHVGDWVRYSIPVAFMPRKRIKGISEVIEVEPGRPGVPERFLLMCSRYVGRHEVVEIRPLASGALTPARKP